MTNIGGGGGAGGGWGALGQLGFNLIPVLNVKVIINMLQLRPVD